MRLLLAVLLCSLPAAAQSPLGSYNVDLAETTVSGLSSGGYMAVQFGVAWSSIVRGVGVFAGGPYWCAQDSLSTATSTCQLGAPSASTSISKTDSYASSGAIDPTSSLAKQRVWIFSGYNDGVVKRSVVDALVSYYGNYASAGAVAYKNNLNAGHAQITDNYGGACADTGGSFVANCGYDGAGLLLRHLFGALQPRNTGTLGGQLTQFDQTQFTATDPYHLSLSHTGYVYVPSACAAGQPCRVHVAFHGCLQNADYVGSDYTARAGYNQWADTNNLIILYPQTVSSSGAPLNPNGCWDWWGYNEAGYATKVGSQIAAVRAMLQRLAGGYTGWSPAPTGAFGPPAAFAANDSSASRVMLSWKGVGGAAGYNVYRAGCASCAFTKLNAVPVKSPSYADAGLNASTIYYYKARAVSGSNLESADSAVASRATAGRPANCDPYYRDNYTHTAESRAYALYGYTYAYGSNDFMGPWSIYSETNLIRASSGYFRAATCP